MRSQRGTHFTIASDDVDHSRWEASFFDELSELQNADRAFLGSLVDEGAPSG